MQTAIVALLGLACLFVGLLLNFILPGIRIYTWGILALGVALIAFAFMADHRRVRGALASRRGTFGVGTTVRVSLFAGIILLVNAISVGNYYRFDFTGLARFTLTSQTREALNKLDSPVEIVSFFAPGATGPLGSYALNLLSEYALQTDQITAREIDPNLNPDQARRYGVNQMGAVLGVVVFTGEEGQRRVYGPQILREAEHAFTGAILEVTGTRQRKIYFLKGHGESGIYTDYDSVRIGLRDNLLQVGELDLLATPAIPEDAAAIVIAGPQRPMAGRELESLKDYLARGGRLFVLLNPNPPMEFRQLLADWWLDIEDGYIVDPTSYVAPHMDNPLVTRERNGFGLAEIYFPGATAVLPRSDMPDNFELGPLVWSSPESWLESNLDPGAEPEFNEGADRKGPLAIGALVSTATDTDASMGTRLVVIGDSDFAANQHFRNGNNAELFLSAVNWLTEGSEIISIDRKVLAIRRLVLSLEEARFLNVSSMALLPLLLLAAAGTVWWRRR